MAIALSSLPLNCGHARGVRSVPGKTGFVRPNHRIDPDACWDAYLWMTGVDALYEEFKANGVTIAREPEIMAYGNEDFDIRDCNGYVLCFGEEWLDKPSSVGRQSA